MPNSINIRPISWMTALISCAPIAPILCWTIANIMKVRVDSPAQLSQVSFGWPIPWITQDQTRFNPGNYPMVSQLYLNKVDPVFTDYHWVPFSVDIILIGVGLGTILWGLLRVWAVPYRKRRTPQRPPAEK